MVVSSGVLQRSLSVTPALLTSQIVHMNEVIRFYFTAARRSVDQEVIAAHHAVVVVLGIERWYIHAMNCQAIGEYLRLRRHHGSAA